AGHVRSGDAGSRRGVAGVMTSVLLIAALSFGVAALLTRLLSSQRLRGLALDLSHDPSPPHLPLPRAGGLAIIAGAACGLAAMAATNGALPSYARWTLGCAMAIALVSFCDDRWTLSPLVRLMLQLAIASALVLGGGVRINGISLPVIG